MATESRRALKWQPVLLRLHTSSTPEKRLWFEMETRLSVRQSVMSALPVPPESRVAWAATELRRFTAEETSMFQRGPHRLSRPAQSDGGDEESVKKEEDADSYTSSRPSPSSTCSSPTGVPWGPAGRRRLRETERRQTMSHPGWNLKGHFTSFTHSSVFTGKRRVFFFNRDSFSEFWKTHGTFFGKIQLWNLAKSFFQ